MNNIFKLSINFVSLIINRLYLESSLHVKDAILKTNKSLAIKEGLMLNCFLEKKSRPYT